MKILMIGGNGFLGTHVKEMLKNEHEILSPRKEDVNWISGKGIESIKDFNPDIVIHLLAIYGGLPFCMNNRLKMSLENLEINANVYRYIYESKPKRIITMGSGCEYPGYKEGMLHEDDLGSGKLHKSVEHYGYSKLMQLEVCKALLEEYNIEFEHIVLAKMYGPGDIFDYNRSHVVGALIKKFIDAQEENKPVNLMGTGTSVRDLVYVKDIANLIKKLILLQKSTNEPLNASTGFGTSIAELAQIISDELNFKNEIIWGNESQDGCKYKILSTKNIETKIGWKPNTSLKEGIKETIQWYKNDKQHQIQHQTINNP